MEGGQRRVKSVAHVIRNKKRQTHLTLQWLDENYCVCEGVCLPRCILYSHYLDFCKQYQLTPACAATFGKTIRQKFPHLTTRRLGTRGHSKYHYYGIGIKETSQYYSTVYTGKGLTRFSGSSAKADNNSPTRKFCLSSKTGTLLPEFPRASELIIPGKVSTSKVETFLNMYKTHCQCMLDTIINGNFEEVQIFILHFWQGLPDHLLPLLKAPVIVDMIAICDSILYKVIVDIVIPANMQEMPETLLRDIRNFGCHFEEWITMSLENVPSNLLDKKLSIAKQLCRILKRYTSFLHVVQAIRPIMKNEQQLRVICKELRQLEIFQLQTIDCDLALNEEIFITLSEILETSEMSVETLLQWLDSLLESRVVKPTKHTGKSFKKRAQDFLLRWTFLGSRVTRYLTLNTAACFASFHAIKMLLDEYILLAIETQLDQETEHEIQEMLRRHVKEDKTVATLYAQAGTCFAAYRPTTTTQSLKTTTNGNIKDSCKRKRTTSCRKNIFSVYHLAPDMKNVSDGVLTPPVSPITTRPTVISQGPMYGDFDEEPMYSCRYEKAAIRGTVPVSGYYDMRTPHHGADEQDHFYSSCSQVGQSSCWQMAQPPPSQSYHHCQRSSTIVEHISVIRHSHELSDESRDPLNLLDRRPQRFSCSDQQLTALQQHQQQHQQQPAADNVDDYMDRIEAHEECCDVNYNGACAYPNHQTITYTDLNAWPTGQIVKTSALPNIGTLVQIT
ncbi:DNA-binding protein RFX6-like [Tubulanus polymorphus]|uniref:DNA-binding protein RFX6-like n=1 Tax=Tubulanus polymorphus TaxID=672921 RepID=UPI003DA38E6D